MASRLLSRGTVIIDEAVQSSATEALKAAGDEMIVDLTFTTSTGRKASLDPAVVDLLRQVLGRVAQGGEVTVQTVPEILTTSAAADLLGVSRPTVMKFIQSGKLEPIMVGTHHRLRHADVETLRAKREINRRAAVAELLELGEDDS